jgi:hypothetical protein
MTFREAPTDEENNLFCSEGYKGLTCGICQSGFHRVNIECIPCPSTPWLAIGIVIGVIATLSGLLVWLSKKYRLLERAISVKEKLPVDMGVLGILITLIQTVASYGNVNLKWSPPVKTAITSVSTLNFNLDIVSPGCAGK